MIRKIDSVLLTLLDVTLCFRVELNLLAIDI